MGHSRYRPLTRFALAFVACTGASAVIMSGFSTVMTLKYMQTRNELQHTEQIIEDQNNTILELQAEVEESTALRDDCASKAARLSLDLEWLQEFPCELLTE